MAVDVDKLKKAIELQPKLTGKGNQKPQITTDFNIDELQNNYMSKQISQPVQKPVENTLQPIQPKVETQSNTTSERLYHPTKGFIYVNPNYVDEYLAQGYSYNTPSQSDVNQLIDIAKQGGQGVWTPGGISVLEGDYVTKSPTSTVTTTYKPVQGYGTLNQQQLAELLKNQMNSSSISSQQNQQKAPITTQPIVKTPVSDNTSDISKLYGEQTNLLINQLKQKIAESKAQQEAIKANAPQQFDPLRSQSELAKAQQLRQVLERSANLGDRGGIGRSEALQTQTAGENRLNAINLQQQNVIDDANRQIAQLESQGRFEEANILGQQKIAELQALMTEKQRVQDIAREDAIRQEQYARQDAQLQRELSEQDFQTQIDTLGQYYSDFSAEIQRREAINPNDPLLPYLRMAREQKRSDIGMDAQGNIIPQDNTSQIWDNAYKKWNSGIPLTQEEMQVLGTNQSVKPKASSGGSSRSGGVVKQSDVIARWKALGYADDTVANYFGIPKNSTYGEAFAQQLQQSQPQGLQVDVPTKTEILSNMQGSLTDRADYIARLILSGQMDEIEASNPSLYDEIEQMALNYGINENVLTQAINRLGVSSQSYGRGNTTQPLTQYR